MDAEDYAPGNCLCDFVGGDRHDQKMIALDPNCVAARRAEAERATRFTDRQIELRRRRLAAWLAAGNTGYPHS